MIFSPLNSVFSSETFSRQRPLVSLAVEGISYQVQIRLL